MMKEKYFNFIVNGKIIDVTAKNLDEAKEKLEVIIEDMELENEE